MRPNFFQKLLSLCGKNYAVDPFLPTSYLLRICLRRALWIVWGFVRKQTIAFIAPTALISGNLTVGKYATIEPHVTINAIGKNSSFIGARTKIGAYSQLIVTAHLSKKGENFIIGEDSGCGEFCYFGAVGGIMIGSRVIMGQYVSFHSQEHQYKNKFHAIKDQGTTEQGIIIGDNCLIGAKATILDGTVLGRHCVVAAGAVVKGKFPDHSVIGGVPARIIRDLADVA